ncbi:MAG TPA: transglutaminaseTgpA domain-containing protein [Acidimicrobiales bacterium]|nr:transglutaminaseTgpA domain-containing protein [Acidimicrobiales bacterium]
MTLVTDPEVESVAPEATDPDPTRDVSVDLAAANGGAPDDETTDEAGVPLRIALAVAFPTLAAAVMVGGIFVGATPYIHAGVAGVAGIALAVGVARIRRPLLANAVVVAGIVAVGLVLLATAGVGRVFQVGDLIAAAARESNLAQPPVPFDAGWHAIVGWLMAIVGFATGWVALVVRRPALALIVPMPLAALAGISVPEDAQVASGAAVLVLFAIGLGLLSSEQATDPDGQRPSIGYEVRKALKALPLIAVVTAALVGLAQTDFLFPPPLIDPAREPQTPKTVPLSEVEDRVLFTVESELSGPWRIGSLDIFDSSDSTWKLPPVADSAIEPVPSDGFVDRSLAPRARARFTVAGLGGVVLPGLPNTVGIIAAGPKLSYDSRNGNVRLAEGEVEPGLTYEVAAAGLPTVAELRQVTSEPPVSVRPFTEIGSPSPSAAELIARAETELDNRWDRFDFLRTHVLDNVVASGAGTPAAITDDRVEDMLTGSMTGSPFEIVALQGMFARWVGVPSRLGYGYDGGEVVNDILEVRPRNGATFVEVHFEGFGWLPVVGTPKKAEPSVGSEGEQQLDPSILPSDDIAVQLFLPILVPPASVLGAQVLRIALAVALAALVIGTVYVLWPAARKSIVRSRRRSAALAAGPQARVALAYAEWRDAAADLGFVHPTDTPLAFLERFHTDEEHEELAWLTTRALWGDLRDDVTGDMANTAEELSRTLRRRLASSQPATVRAVAAVSRIAQRRPYAPDTDLTQTDRARLGRRRRGQERTDAPVPV